MPTIFAIPSLDLAGMPPVAALVSILSRTGDVIALSGELGAGKTTFARALIAHLLAEPDAEVPSPTFTLLQPYETARFPVYHYDFYRLQSADEVHELGFDDNLANGLSLIEWPERAVTVLPADRLELRLDPVAGEPGLRRLTLTGLGSWAARVERLLAIRGFLQSHAAADASICFLQGDASPRRYARLLRPGARPAVLMDAPRMPDGPPIRNGLPYSRMAHLAEDVRPFVAIASALRKAGLSAPEVYAADLAQGLLLIEDFGDTVFGREIASGTSIADLYRPAVDALLTLRSAPAPELLPLGGGAAHRVPSYDAPALGIEVELLTDWYWPAAKGSPCPPDDARAFLQLFNSLFDRVLAARPGWVVRDYHSPNLVWLPQRQGVARVGVLDFQDALRGHPAYDLVSLLQDARLDVPAELERQLRDHYCAAVQGSEQGFDAQEFATGYAILGAQRNTKILGIFARLARRDGKRGYLAHVPRIWGYIERNLAHPELAPLKAWFDRNFPRHIRTRPLPE